MHSRDDCARKFCPPTGQRCSPILAHGIDPTASDSAMRGALRIGSSGASDVEKLVKAVHGALSVQRSRPAAAPIHQQPSFGAGLGPRHGRSSSFPHLPRASAHDRTGTFPVHVSRVSPRGSPHRSCCAPGRGQISQPLEVIPVVLQREFQMLAGSKQDGLGRIDSRPIPDMTMPPTFANFAPQVAE